MHCKPSLPNRKYLVWLTEKQAAKYLASCLTDIKSFFSTMKVKLKVLLCIVIPIRHYAVSEKKLSSLLLRIWGLMAGRKNLKSAAGERAGNICHSMSSIKNITVKSFGDAGDLACKAMSPGMWFHIWESSAFAVYYMPKSGVKSHTCKSYPTF